MYYCKRAKGCSDNTQCNRALNLLGLTGQCENVIEEFEDGISSDESINEHFNVKRLLSSDDVVNANSSKEAARIQFLRSIEAAYHIKPLDVACETKGSFEMTEDMYIYNLVKRSTMQEPTTFQELRKLYVVIRQHITCNAIIIAKQCSKGERRKQSTIVFTRSSSSHTLSQTVTTTTI